MNHDQLFIETLKDLGARTTRAGTEYNTIMSAALLRKLLLEAPTLIDQVNRSRRLKLEFVINGRPPIWEVLGERPTFHAVEDGFDPGTALAGSMPVAVNRDQLLARVVALHRNQEITAGQLIRFAANTAGGVHFDPPWTDPERAAQALGEQMFVGGSPAGSRTLVAVGRVVVRGLSPLRTQIEQDMGLSPA